MSIILEDDFRVHLKGTDNFKASDVYVLIFLKAFQRLLTILHPNCKIDITLVKTPHRCDKYVIIISVINLSIFLALRARTIKVILFASFS